MKEITYLNEHKKECVLEVFPLDPTLDKESMKYIKELNIEKEEDITKQDLKEFVKLTTRDEKTYIRFISIIDTFDRKHRIFRSANRLHLRALEKNRKYRKLFDKIKYFSPDCTFYPDGKPSSLQLLMVSNYLWTSTNKRCFD